MQCPSCGAFTADDWRKLYKRQIISPQEKKQADTTLDVPGPYDPEIPRQDQKPHAVVEITWMVCANPKCHDLVIRMHETRPTLMLKEVHSGGHVGGFEQQTTTSLVRPRFAIRPLDQLVPESYRRDYLEAAAILDLSPRMSAVLSRKIVGDLLAEYAGQRQRRITQQIDAFNADKSYPRSIRENLHHLREIADFGAHTQRDERDEIVEATREEAEWTLDVVDRLIDHFIVTPTRDAAIRDSFDAKIAAVPGRKPITPLPEDPQES